MALLGDNAQSFGLTVERFNVDAQSDETKARIMTEGDAGVARGFKNSPTIFVIGGEERGSFNREILQAAIEAAKKKS